MDHVTKQTEHQKSAGALAPAAETIAQVPGHDLASIGRSTSAPGAPPAVIASGLRSVQQRLGNRAATVWLARMTSGPLTQPLRFIQRDVDAVILQLTNSHANNTFVNDGGLIKINDQLVVSEEAWATIAANDKDEIVRESNTLNTSTNGQEKTAARSHLEKFVGSKSYRLRFTHNVSETAEYFVGQNGVVAASEKDAFRALWNAAALGAKQRAFDVENRSWAGGSEGVPTSAASYALSKNPATLFEFVDHFEFYVAMFDEKAQAKKKELDTLIAQKRVVKSQAIDPNLSVKDKARAEQAATQAAQDEALTELFGVTPGAKSKAPYIWGKGQVNATQASNSYASYLAAVQAVQMVGGTGLGQLADRTKDTVIAAIKAIANSLKFTSESSAAYHVAKHWSEISGLAATATPQVRAQAYVGAARATVAGADAAAAKAQAKQLGGTSYIFLVGPMRAIVHVDVAVTSAVIATFGKV